MRVAVFSLLLMLSSVAFAGTPAKGCGPGDQAWSVQTHSTDPTLPTPEPGKAVMVYLNRGEFGALSQVKLAVDGQWKVATSRHSYAAFQVEPGEHSVCAQTMRNKIWIPISIEVGKTYFLSEDSGMLSVSLEIIDSANGRAQMANMKLAISNPKN